LIGIRAALLEELMKEFLDKKHIKNMVASFLKNKQKMLLLHFKRFKGDVYKC